MIIVVNDANVLIDLVKLKLLPCFFSLHLEFYTTDLILHELHDWQLQELQVYINNGKLTVIELTVTELIEISLLQAEKRQLSEQDCSAIVCARKVAGNLLTSDNKLRKFAAKKLLTVYGHLWVFDRMVETSIITPQVAIEKLTELREVINPRLNLPIIECETRLELWRLL
jgi:predicted nucleic acid-binding protein